MRRVLPPLAVLCLAFAPAPLPKPGRGGDDTAWLQKAVTTASGLKYQDLEASDKSPARKGDVVQVEYTVWLARGGKKVGGSLDHKDRFRFELGDGEVIQGLDEGVTGMRVLSRRRLLVPSRLAYGGKGRGRIPANADLIIEVELLKILPVEG
jgi:FKBP-type peptidyl-prolyl cis-trans isomerase